MVLRKSPRPKAKRPKRPLKPLRPHIRIRTVSVIPFNVPFIGLNFVIVGQVVVRSPSRFTTSDGDIHGSVNKAFALNQSQPEVTGGTTTGTQVGVRLELTGRRIDVRWRAVGGPWTQWSDIVSW